MKLVAPFALSVALGNYISNNMQIVTSMHDILYRAKIENVEM
jgi:hypothetical protein